ncbi:MAG: alpha/beta fold hydrolase [Calditrichaeota bacterium]|nr:MAG: alpha/beta fold hydrolase [Calditrichota bacterium]
MKILRTPEERFQNLPDFPFAPHYIEVDGLRLHYVDEGHGDAPPVLMLHGEPTWSYLYRHMIPVFVRAGLRALAPDNIGFGRSDKPAAVSDYTYQRHVDWIGGWLEQLDLREITLVCQDWGAHIGLRLVAEQPDRFVRVVVANGTLPTGDRAANLAFRLWKLFALYTPKFPVGWIVNAGCVKKLTAAERAAYNAPFPDESYKAGARAFPRLVPVKPTDPAAPANRAAWDVLKRWDKPFLTAFSDGDPIMRGGDREFQRLVPGARNQPHVTIKRAGHFVQEDKGVELAQVTVDFIQKTS